MQMSRLLTHLSEVRQGICSSVATGPHVSGESGKTPMIQLHIEYKGPQTAPSVLQKAPSDEARQQASEDKQEKCNPVSRLYDKCEAMSDTNVIRAILPWGETTWL